MKELTIENLSKTYGVKVLLDGVNFAIRTGDRIGLIGLNGTGKSSLLKVIVGLDTYDAGEISKPNHYTMAYLDQHPQLKDHQTILETVFESPSPLVQLVKAYEQAVEALQKDPENPTNLDRFNRLSDRMQVENSWDLEVQAKTILTQLGLKDLSRRVAGCSGGEQKRIGLAQVLISQPDLLILDEPTNHLDVPAIQWLEKYLATYQGALLLVTHDRYFLERSVNKIVELRQGHLHTYEGNYQAYLTKRAEEAAIQERMQEKQDKLYLQELAWMRKGAKARTTKQQARIERFQDLKATIHQRPQEADSLAFDFNQQRIGNQILEWDHVSLSVAGKTVVTEFSKTFIKGDRLGIVGNNGVGKSTLMNALAGLHPLDEGVSKVGQTVRMAYYQQLDADLPGDMRVLTYLTQIADHFKRSDGTSVSAAQMLERFHFARESHGTAISQLSGGERRRLYLLTLLIQEPNVLLLDEPTNDLDIETLTVLEDYLATFEGVVMVVSHDRYFLDKTVDQILEIQGQGKFQLYYGNYSQYLEVKAQTAVATAGRILPTTNLTKASIIGSDDAAAVATTQGESRQRKPKLTYMEKKEWETIEERIYDGELKADEIREAMNIAGSDAGKLMDLQRELDQIQDQLTVMYERYDYLSQRA